MHLKETIQKALLITGLAALAWAAWHHPVTGLPFFGVVAPPLCAIALAGLLHAFLPRLKACASELDPFDVEGATLFVYILAVSLFTGWSTSQRIGLIVFCAAGFTASACLLATALRQRLSLPSNRTRE